MDGHVFRNLSVLDPKYGVLCTEIHAELVMDANQPESELSTAWDVLDTWSCSSHLVGKESQVVIRKCWLNCCFPSASSNDLCFQKESDTIQVASQQVRVGGAKIYRDG